MPELLKSRIATAEAIAVAGRRRSALGSSSFVAEDAGVPSDASFGSDGKLIKTFGGDPENLPEPQEIEAAIEAALAVKTLSP